MVCEISSLNGVLILKNFEIKLYEMTNKLIIKVFQATNNMNPK
jgi:hypothetical protein